MKNPLDAAKRVTKNVASKVKKRAREVRVDLLDTGDENTPLGQRTKQQLYNRARQLGVAGRSRMSKSQLVNAIRRKQ